MLRSPVSRLHAYAVGRELTKGMTRDRDLHKPTYRASTAQKDGGVAGPPAEAGQAGRQPRLREVVQAGLEQEHSPEQIANRLPLDFPDDPEMRVSHETIYQSIYVQGRGALRRELTGSCAPGGRCANPTAPAPSAAAGSRTWSTSAERPARGRRTGRCPATGKAT